MFKNIFKKIPSSGYNLCIVEYTYKSSVSHN